MRKGKIVRRDLERRAAVDVNRTALARAVVRERDRPGEEVLDPDRTAVDINRAAALARSVAIERAVVFDFEGAAVEINCAALGRIVAVERAVAKARSASDFNRAAVDIDRAAFFTG